MHLTVEAIKQQSQCSRRVKKHCRLRHFGILRQRKKKLTQTERAKTQKGTEPKSIPKENINKSFPETEHSSNVPSLKSKPGTLKSVKCS